MFLFCSSSVFSTGNLKTGYTCSELRGTVGTIAERLPVTLGVAVSIPISNKYLYGRVVVPDSALARGN